MSHSNTSTLVPSRIAEAYDPALFLEHGQVVLREIEAFLSRSQRCQGKVLNWRMPSENLHAAAALLDQPTGLQALLRTTFDRGQTLHDPRYIGHQVAAPIPLAALMESVSAVANQGMTVYEMGPWSSAVERVMIQRLGEQLGLQPGFGGILTSGGSLANLTALLTARNIALGTAWQHGVPGGAASGVILASPESHYCIERAAGILGLGTDGCVRVALDAAGRIDPDRLRHQIEGLQRERRPVIAVVASACTTRAGTYDPLRAIASVCRDTGVWLHVDAAHGGAAAFSARHAHRLDGIEQADSVVWDAHKMMFIPALSTYLFYRRAQDQCRAANQDAPYLFDEAAERVEAYNTGLGTIECTKRAAALSLWAVWSVHGPALFSDLVDSTFGMARCFADRLAAEEDFDLLNEPEANIVLFRFVPAPLRGVSDRAVGQFQKAVRQRLIESGEAYIVPAVDRGVDALRLVVMNPLTTEQHLEQVLASLRRFGAELLDPAAPSARAFLSADSSSDA
jgi:L-2,4-diaminobutyrate decarboxylase